VGVHGVGSPDYVILGGGIAGSSLAIELASRGYGVLLVKRDEGSTPMSAGLFVTLMPENLMEFVAGSLKFYRRHGCLRTLLSRGALVIAGKEAASRILDIHLSWGLSSREASPDDFEKGLEEKLVVAEWERTLLVDELLFDVGKLLECLYKRMSALGVSVKEASIVSPRALREAARGAQVIVSAGAFTGSLVGGLGGRALVYRCQAFVAKCEGLGVVLEDLVNDFYSVPVDSWSTIIGDGSNEVIGEPSRGFAYSIEDAYRVLENYARRVRGAHSCYISRIWSSPCIVGGDGYPLIGKMGDLYLFTGFNGSGLSLAPGMASLLADYMEGKVKRLPAHLECGRRIDAGADRVVEPYDLI